MIYEINETIRSEVSFRAVVTTPSGFDPEKESLPMIVFLHGAGERGEELSSVKIHGIPKLFSADPDYQGHRVITVSPQCPLTTVWNDLSIPLFDFVLRMAEKYRADRDRISITGISMGGFGTWELLVSHPDFFSAAAPICGGGMDWRIPRKMKTPIRAFHCEGDPVVPVDYSRRMCGTVTERGGSAELTVFPGNRHNAWDPAYEQTDLIAWLIGARRSPVHENP